MRSPILDKVFKDMEKDPWHVKLKRWWRVAIWVWVCRTRFIWDLDYQHNIFKKRKK
jgi:predicted chitinase